MNQYHRYAPGTPAGKHAAEGEAVYSGKREHSRSKTRDPDAPPLAQTSGKSNRSRSKYSAGDVARRTLTDSKAQSARDNPRYIRLPERTHEQPDFGETLDIAAVALPEDLI